MRAHVRVGLIVISLLAITLLPASPGLAAPAQERDDARARRAEVYARLMQATLQQRSGEYRAAAGEIRKAVELMPDTPAVLIEAAELLHRIGRLQDAEELARHALEVEPDNRAALTFVADLAAARALRPGRPDRESRDEALRLYERLLEGDGENEEMLRKVISLRLQAEDREGALAAARLLTTQRPGDRQATGLLAQLLLEGGQHREALAVLLDFIARHPGDSALVRLAEDLARELDAWDLVEEVFDEHGDLGDNAVDAHRLRSEALLRLDRVESASRALEKVLRSDPTDRAVRYHLARTYRRLGRLGEAADLAQQLADEAPDDRDVHLYLAEILDEQGDVDGALEAFAITLRLSEAEGGTGEQALGIREAVRRRMALLHVSRENFAAAGRLLDELENPDHPAALQIAARKGIVTEEWASARHAVKRLRAIGEIGSAALLEAEIQLRSKRGARVQPKIAEALSELGAFTRLRLVEVYLDLDRSEEAVDLLRSWVDAEPENADAHYHLGSLFYRLERLEESEVELRAAFEIDPEHSAALNFLGYSFAERGTRLEEALELIQQALAVDAWNGAYLDSLGWTYFRMGRFDEAREPLEQAARTYPKDPVVLEHLGDLYERVGELGLAIAAWNRALEAGADDAENLRSKIRLVAREQSRESTLSNDPP